MCGIVAMMDAEAVDRDAVHRAVDALAHRGPDEQHSWFSPDGRAALGHTRLSIIDLETGAQPLGSEDGRCQLVVNGEFYDYERIRGELVQRGHQFRSKSDSEIALHLYEESGAACLEQLRGEFAFAVYDGRDGSLFAARDRFGIKPLFYTLTARGLVLASEAKALFAAGVDARWSDDGMFQILHFAQTAEQSLFHQVHQLPPGHYLVYRNGRLALHRYWDTDYPRRSSANGVLPGEELEGVRRQLEDAVRLRTRADVPLGCYLSGGVDSSAVLGLAREMTGGNIRAFSVAFDHPAYDESGPASEMAAHAGVDFHPVRVSGKDFAEVFEASVAQGEMLQYNGHAPARFLLSRAVRDAGIKSVLGGEGADELFGGYRFAQRALRNDSRGAAGMLWRFLRAPKPSGLADFSPMLARLSGVLGMSAGLLELAEARIAVYRELFDRDFLQRHRGRDPFRVFFAQFRLRDFAGREAYKVITPLWLKSHFVNYVLAGERLDMAHAVELRLPFLDHHLFEHMRGIPAAHLVRDGENKALLRRIAANTVCPSVLNGAKKPFFAPPGSADDALHELFQDLLRSEAFRSVPFFDHAAVGRLLDRLPDWPEGERMTIDPILYLLASTAVLDRAYQLGGN